MTQPHYVVGAYASLPAQREDQSQYYDLLGAQSWIDGAEIPYPGDMADPQTRAWLAQHLPVQWHRNTLTLIPGTMQHVNANPLFGLASPDEQGRQEALQFLREACAAIADFAALRGSQDIIAVQIHSAPTAHASSQAMRQSIAEISQWDWSGAQLVIEHCDKYIDGQNPEKGFLSVEDEIALCEETGIGLTINWGRSCLEQRDAAAPQQHIRAAADAGVLRGVMFSGAGPEETQYGYAWIDGHLPMAPDEPSSWMTDERVSQCTAAAGSAPLYIGAKVCVPKDANCAERLAYLDHIHAASVAEHNREDVVEVV